MRTIKLENGKEVQISEESYKELLKAVQKKDYNSLEEMYSRNKDSGFYSDIDFGIYEDDDSTKYKFRNEGHVYDKKVLLQEKARRHLWNIAYILNDGWKPNWHADYEPKWYLIYSYSEKQWVVNYQLRRQFCVPIFETEKLAKKAIKLMDKANLLDDYRGA